MSSTARNTSAAGPLPSGSELSSSASRSIQPGVSTYTCSIPRRSLELLQALDIVVRLGDVERQIVDPRCPPHRRALRVDRQRQHRRIGVGIVALVEDVSGHRGQIDRDGAFADAALLIENDMHSHRRPFRMLPPRDGGVLRTKTALAYGAPWENLARRHAADTATSVRSSDGPLVIVYRGKPANMPLVWARILLRRAPGSCGNGSGSRSLD